LVPLHYVLPFLGYRFDELTDRYHGIDLPESLEQYLEPANQRISSAYLRKRITLQAIPCVQKRLVPDYHH